jgi:hypothetical protein
MKLHMILATTMLFMVYQVEASGSLLKDIHGSRSFDIEWDGGFPEGSIEVINGTFHTLQMVKGAGDIGESKFKSVSDTPFRIQVSVSDGIVEPGPGATIVTVYREKEGFSFFLRDVRPDFPIIIPDYGVTVLPAGDGRSYEDVLNGLRKRGLWTKLEVIQNSPEESFDNAARHTRNQSCPIWLGLPRDFRHFEVDLGLNYHQSIMETIRPLRAGGRMKTPELGDTPVEYSFSLGRGIGTSKQVSRRLEEGTLPILHADFLDETVSYETRSFVSFERSHLSEESLRGTHYLVADGYSPGHMFTDNQQAEFNRLEQGELEREEEAVLYFKAKAVNIGAAPTYAYFKAPVPKPHWQADIYTFDAENGFFILNSGRVFSIAKLNGKPVPFEESSILVAPGETAVFEFALSHSPLSRKRALELVDWDFEERLSGCRTFWKRKLSTAAKIRLPEKRIEEMIQAGLLHLDMITYGLEPAGTLAPTIGAYSPIGSESAPIIQFMNSMGWHDTAQRSLQYFFDKQHENGFIQNYGGYMLETGAALWSMGEYFRYTRDDNWLRSHREKILKACQYLLEWRERNKIETLRGRGYGMIDGKVADPNDPYHSYMLNGYGYLGIARAAEVFSVIDPEEGKRLAAEAAAWCADIRNSYFVSEMRSPVIPLADGTWCPTVPPWTEAQGPKLLYIRPERLWSHGAFTGKDALLGPLYLVFQEVIDYDEPAAVRLLKYHADNLYLRNAAFSQPYYSRHAWVELKQGLVKPFLKTYYNTFSGLADRETYTFWEHYYQVTPHKTHEEGWFLMQTRWMLWMEEGETLNLLSGIPRAWLGNGKRIELENIATYFGRADLHVESHIENGWIEAEVECLGDRKPETVTVRMPHPDGAQPVVIHGGEWDSLQERIVVKNFKGKAKIKVVY